MRYYDVNGPGNSLGPKSLVCPICGNAALAEIGYTSSVTAVIKNGLFTVKASDDRTEDALFHLCPQCGIRMVKHSEVVDSHREAGCVGCMICGLIEPNILKICTECVSTYQDVGRGGCDGCPYDYSRAQMGIDIAELKEHHGVQDVPWSDWGGESWGEQEELFRKGFARRRHYDDKLSITK